MKKMSSQVDFKKKVEKCQVETYFEKKSRNIRSKIFSKKVKK